MKRVSFYFSGTNTPRPWVFVAALLTVAAAVVAVVLLWPHDPGRVGDPVCAVTVSGSPAAGTPSMLPDGAGSCLR